MEKRRFKFIFVMFTLFSIISSIIIVNGKNISTDYPEDVNINEEFDFLIKLIDFPKNNYSIKFEIKNGSKNIAKRYWDNEWKSTNYWLNNAFLDENEKNFKLKIIDGVGNNEIKIKIRDKKEIWIFESFFIYINPSVKNSERKNEKEYSGEKDNKKIEIDWNKNEIINREEFEFEIDSKLKGEDIRVWIEDDGEIISERYDENADEWKSGRFYINKFNSKNVRLRIKNEFIDFSGKADLFIKTREGIEYKDNIIVLKNNIENLNESIKNDNKFENKEEKNISLNYFDNKIVYETTAGSTIKLGFNIESEDKKNSLIYESKNEKIKKYSVYAFLLFCIFLFIFIAWRKLWYINL